MTTLRVEDVFLFKDDLTVIVGEAADAPPRIEAALATVFLRGERVGSLHIIGERIAGVRGGRSLRSVETKDSLEWNMDQVRRGKYELRWGI